MKMYELGIDANGRSTPGVIEVPLNKISDTEAITAPQPGTLWRIGTRNSTDKTRSHKDYDSGGGAYEMHLGGDPHIIAWQAGYNENTYQDGTTYRFAPGDLLYVRPGSLHHANLMSVTPSVVYNLYMPGGVLATQTLEWKK